jgi:hypothetical protein
MLALMYLDVDFEKNNNSIIHPLILFLIGVVLLVSHGDDKKIKSTLLPSLQHHQNSSKNISKLTLFNYKPLSRWSTIMVMSLYGFALYWTHSLPNPDFAELRRTTSDFGNTIYRLDRVISTRSSPGENYNDVSNLIKRGIELEKSNFYWLKRVSLNTLNRLVGKMENIPVESILYQEDDEDTLDDIMILYERKRRYRGRGIVVNTGQSHFKHTVFLISTIRLIISTPVLSLCEYSLLHIYYAIFICRIANSYSSIQHSQS